MGIEKCHTYAALLEARTFIENIRQFNMRHASISWRQSGKVQDGLLDTVGVKCIAIVMIMRSYCCYYFLCASCLYILLNFLHI